MIKRFQALLQWVFLRVEGLFNAAFGDRINPFYHLGPSPSSCSVVGASGLYLYIFSKPVCLSRIPRWWR